MVKDTTPVDLRDGWNLITRTINGQARTFFVFGDTEAPTFQVNPNQPLAVNPNGLAFDYVLHGTVTDNSFGQMSFAKKFSDLQDREIFRDASGQYLLLEFTIQDLAGNATPVSIQLRLDPNAPLVPGTRSERPALARAAQDVAGAAGALPDRDRSLSVVARGRAGASAIAHLPMHRLGAGGLPNLRRATPT